jgi:peptidoglycan hydrolase-like protein with peptidoglycan-binding domain
MNVRTLAFAISCLTATSLAGCSNQTPPPAPPPAPAAAAPEPAPPAQPAMPAGLTPAQQRIAKVQTALNSNGAQLEVDGKMGPKTVAALKSYQSAHNLKASGRADAATAKALGI